MPRAAIVGAGPAGFYTAAQLLAAGWEVDLFERLPTPFGLVRAGVAPDHPKIRSVTRVYERTARKPGFRFFGGVELGRDITRADLLDRYHAIVYATGATQDRPLGIPGEDRPGVLSATRFAAWYNGHPDAAEHAIDLRGERAVVIGNGNVALDVARMLVLADGALAVTDAADHALAALAASGVRDILVVGRRGPAQAAFTHPELRELNELDGVALTVHADGAELDAASAAWLAEHGSPTAGRNVELLATVAAAGDSDHPRRIVLRFLASPVAILGDGDHGPVTGVRLARNRIEAGPDGALRAVAAGETEDVDCGLVLLAAGHRGEELAGVAFDAARGIIPTEDSRVLDGRGEYAVGWIKRGPSGVIGTNKADATATVAAIVADADAGALNTPSIIDPAETETFLRDRVGRLVGWDGWRAIDAAETGAGEPHGRPRVKLVGLDDLHAAATGGRDPG